jgi:hypothetical protein
VVPGGAIIPTLSIDTSSFQVGEFFRLPESCTWSVDGHQSSQWQNNCLSNNNNYITIIIDLNNIKNRFHLFSSDKHVEAIFTNLSWRMSVSKHCPFYSNKYVTIINSDYILLRHSNSRKKKPIG